MKQHIVVTGATKGIGLAIVKSFAKQGFNIAFCSRNENDLVQLANELSKQYPNQQFIYKVCDVSKQQELKAFSEYIQSSFGTVDVLVNNAGVFIPGQLADEDEGVFETQMQTNLNSAYYLTRYMLPLMYSTEKPHIFNICSTASFVPYVNGGSYCISKFALLGFSKVLRQQLMPKGVRVTAVMPGATLTESWSGTTLPEDRFIATEDVASQILGIYQLPKTTVIEELVIRPMLGDIG
ncbi:MAG: SDR family oxidoreductase [Bacteroidetes bacterium]|nr:SDR family oxidoreductase [Bacteroidota bacterium]